MPRIGTPLSPSATRVLLCGSGELGKEVVIELQRLGVEVIAVDRYANAPAMQVAHRSHVINMLDDAALRSVIELEQPHYVVPEIEAIATATLVALENEGFTVIPSARAAQLTMNREGIPVWRPKSWACRPRLTNLPTHSKPVARRCTRWAFPA
jgi:phosphoribosylglycinamide formyltransferase 2